MNNNIRNNKKSRGKERASNKKIYKFKQCDVLFSLCGKEGLMKLAALLLFFNLSISTERIRKYSF